MGICGADGNAIQAQLRDPQKGFGFAGDVEFINVPLFKSLLSQNITLVIAPITHNKKGQLLNTNADTIARELAKGLSAEFDVHLIFSFEKSGVLNDARDEKTVIPAIDEAMYVELKKNKIIADGMVPKLDNAFAALKNGVSSVTIGNADHLMDLITGRSGTSIQLTL
jgi:acetylglutamate kinase